MGYPWETEQSVLSDIETVKDLLSYIDEHITNSITLAFFVTPFSPEPMTPMQYDRANIHINWRDLLAGKMVYEGKHIKAFIITAIGGPFSLLKRTWINRAETNDLEAFKAVVYDSRVKRMPERYKVEWLLNNGKIDPGICDGVDSSGCDYLRIGKGE